MLIEHILADGSTPENLVGHSVCLPHHLSLALSRKEPLMKINFEIDTTNPQDTEHAARVVAALTSALSPTVNPLHPSTGYKPEPVEAPEKPAEPKRKTKKVEPEIATLPENLQPAEKPTVIIEPEPEEDDTPMALAPEEDDTPMALAPEEDLVAAAESTAETLTLKDVQDIGRALLTSSKDGREKLAKVLESFGAANLRGLSEDQYADAAAALKAAM